MQSLSHASVQEETQGWGEKSSTTTSTMQGAVNLDPLLRGVPGVDPSVLLLLHRSPWADDVIDGIRKEVACFEWQGRDRYEALVRAGRGVSLSASWLHKSSARFLSSHYQDVIAVSVQGPPVYPKLCCAITGVVALAVRHIRAVKAISFFFSVSRWCCSQRK